MKKIYLPVITFLFLTTTSMKCYKESDNCHLYYSVQNNSSSEIYYLLAKDSTLNGYPVQPNFAGNSNLGKCAAGQVYKTTVGYCFEEFVINRLYGDTVYPFIFDPQVINNTPWDSIVAKKLYLKRYKYSLDDFRQSNWVVTYP